MHQYSWASRRLLFVFINGSVRIAVGVGTISKSGISKCIELRTLPTCQQNPRNPITQRSEKSARMDFRVNSWFSPFLANPFICLEATQHDYDNNVTTRTVKFLACRCLSTKIRL